MLQTTNSIFGSQKLIVDTVKVHGEAPWYSWIASGILRARAGTELCYPDKTTSTLEAISSVASLMRILLGLFWCVGACILATRGLKSQSLTNTLLTKAYLLHNRISYKKHKTQTTATYKDHTGLVVYQLFQFLFFPPLPISLCITTRLLEIS